MIVDANFDFSDQQALTGTNDVNSANIYDAGSAKKLFEGAPGPHALKVCVDVTASGGNNPTFRARFVGADDEALTTNPIILADTGVSAVIAASDLPVHRELIPQGQRTAKQYYGVIYTQSGGSPTATVNAQGVIDAQSNLLR